MTGLHLGKITLACGEAAGDWPTRRCGDLLGRPGAGRALGMVVWIEERERGSWQFQHDLEFLVMDCLGGNEAHSGFGLCDCQVLASLTVSGMWERTRVIA